MMKFETLSELLGLDSMSSKEERLRTLARWCHEVISTDIHLEKEPLDEQYSGYLQLARFYLDEFEPNIPQDLEQPVAVFGEQSILEIAATYGLDRVLLSLKPSRDLINSPNKHGMTLLHVAAIEGNLNTVKSLIHLGADPYKANAQQQLAVFSSLFLPMAYDDELKEEKIKVYQFLKETAPDTLKQLDTSHSSVLELMASNNFPMLIADLLVSNQELALTPNNHSHFPVHNAILNNNHECARILLNVEGGAVVTDSQGMLPVHYAARYSDGEMVALCGDVLNNLDALDVEGKTPFMLAVEANNLSTMSALVSRGALVNLTDFQGQTALHLAVRHSEFDTVLWLLDNTDIDINAVDQHKQTALSLCMQTDKEDFIKLLVDRGATSMSGQSFVKM